MIAPRKFFPLSFSCKIYFFNAFYPDYIVLFTNKVIGIFDTKSGETVQSQETIDKANALKKYILQEKDRGKNLRGAIIQLTNSGFYLFERPNYQPNNFDGWDRLDF